MSREIKALLIKKGIKQSDIATELEVTPGCISGVVNGHYRSKRVEQAIADKLKMPYQKVWRGNAA